LPLRYLMRHRADLITQAAQQVQLMQKEEIKGQVSYPTGSVIPPIDRPLPICAFS